MLAKFAAIFSVLVLACTLGHSNDCTAGVPTDQVRTTVDQVLVVLNDPALKSAGAESKRRAEFVNAIFPRFDFEEMAKRSLGSEWRRRNPAEQKEFVRLFTDLLEDSYVRSIESYRGDKVIYRRETQDGAYAEVGTTIVTERGEEFAIDYRLHLEGSEWKSYDVIIENVSSVNNYRSQFRRVLGRSSFAELLQMIRDRIK
jgi:phospholipid transport system substrate-binding protein